MTYFISGHRDITPEEFEKFYVPAIVDVIDDCPIVHYVGGFETDRDRDSGTAENILRRHTMKYLNPSFYGQQ